MDDKKEIQKKFLDKNISYTATASLDREVNELNECLKSEGVNLSTGDILRAYDIYLRIVGLGRDATTGEEEELKGIFTLFGPVTVGDFTEKINSGEVSLEAYETIYDAINEIMEHEDNCSKFEDYKTVRNSLMILFKEFTIFTNEVLNELSTTFTNDFGIELYSIEMHSDVKSIIFSIFTEGEAKFTVVSIMSCMVSDVMPSAISVIADTFPDNVIKVFAEKKNYNDITNIVEDSANGNE